LLNLSWNFLAFKLVSIYGVGRTSILFSYKIPSLEPVRHGANHLRWSSQSNTEVNAHLSVGAYTTKESSEDSEVE
jgi:hypothetical protein